MTTRDQFALTPQTSAYPGEVAARIADFLVRKSKQVPHRIDTICRIIEQKVLNAGVRENLLSLVRKFRGEYDSTLRRRDELSDDEWSVLVTRIENHGHATSIENYSEYLFSMEGLGPFEKK